MPVTIHDLVVHRIGAPETQTSFSGADYERAGLPMLGGCEGCEATIAGYNSYPSATGFLRCADCIGDYGWDAVEQADHDIFVDPDGCDRRMREIADAARARRMIQAEEGYDNLVAMIADGQAGFHRPAFDAKTATILTDLVSANPFVFERTP